MVEQSPVDLVQKKYQLKSPKLISITTNGAELAIIEGMHETLNTGPEYISLAITGDHYQDAMQRHGYTYLADDDRGFTFKRNARAA